MKRVTTAQEEGGRMGIEVVVDPAALVAAAGSLLAGADATSAAAACIRSVDPPGEPSMAAGVVAVADAWGGVAELLGSTTGVLATLVERAAAGYVATDRVVRAGVAAR
jgi:hypothetical protein